MADGVYETLVDGMEIEELQASEKINVKHYLFADSHFTWWACGKSYLCRIIDMLHMGYVDEVLFGREVVEELPRIVREWAAIAGATRRLLNFFWLASGAGKPVYDGDWAMVIRGGMEIC